MLPRVFKRTNTFPANFINEFFNDDFFPATTTFNRSYNNSPAVNVEETDKEFIVNVAAPGIDKKDFNVNIDNNVLVISSNIETENEEKDNSYILKEYSYNSFSRKFSLPEDTDANKIKASHKNGILKINIPKVQVKVEKAVEVKIN